ncbi:MAG: hypothetical protein RLZZ444_4323 [Pseudomonadota bacterium]|jgi:hypothetical protein
MRSIRPWVIGAAFFVAAFMMQSASWAEELRRSVPVGVIELFTSQGCSNCPKVDAAFERLSEEPNLVTIAYHVDYWNYLGWQDTLSAKENTDRQYNYARTLGNSNVYTPQLVLNGIRDIKFSNREALVSRLETMRKQGEGVTVPVEATLSSDELTINIGAGQGKADVVIAYLRRETIVDIDRGENKGRTVTYRNAVTSLETVGMWDGKSLTVKLPSAMLAKRGYDGCAILLQTHDKAGNPGRILGAAAL